MPSPRRGAPPIALALGLELQTRGFANIAEAYVFLDADGQNNISEFELSRGLHLLAIQCDALALITAIDPMGRSAGVLAAEEFARYCAFGPQPRSR